MKRFLTLLFILVLCLSLGMSALADVIYEPEDTFFKKHRDECHYENRVYIASGENGYASAKKNPTSNKAEWEIPNGTEVYISFVWDQDGGWGLKDSHGWISMSQLTVKYDGISFAQEHGGEFRYLEEWEFLDLTGRDCLHLWRYPGDAEPFNTLSGSGEDAWWGWPPEEMSVNTIYEDPEGRRWGYVNYYYGLRDFWVCLTAPDDASLGGGEPTQPVEAAPTEAPSPTDAPVSTEAPMPTEAPAPTQAPASPEPTHLPPLIDPEPPAPTLWGPALLAFGAIAVAGVLLAVFRRKK
ncbi:MAG: hypothetical protein IKN89_14365 [Oscillospiraceae bacterium]|nr:hypothetical protein [Oscillospiraceae bacterium]